MCGVGVTPYFMLLMETQMATKVELEKLLKILKEETAKLQKVNKQRFDRIKELEERMKIQGIQLSLFFEVLGQDRRHRGFAQLVQMLGRLTQFWHNKPMSKLEEQIRGMEENGLLNLEDIDEDDVPPFLR
jgi:hypothetical protein|tara:strand:- start:179 stop:568 length:390 start_codon:yes stop_codon:yes gene_type:complete